MIHCADLAYRYPGGAELLFPDLNVPQGGVMLLRGASGSGKSTWLALAGALLRPTRGRIAVAGQDLTRLGKMAGDTWRAKSIGFLPQKLYLSEALTVAGNLAMAQWAAGAANDKEAVSRALARLGLSDLARRKPSQLSGGQAQRVALARAVLLSPQVILADEPTASLDDDAARAALELLATTAQQLNATLVIATHDQRVVQALPQANLCQIDLQVSNNVRE